MLQFTQFPGVPQEVSVPKHGGILVVVEDVVVDIEVVVIVNGVVLESAQQ